MAVRDVLTYPHPMLKQVCAPAQPEEVDQVVTDLLDTMDSFDHCVGLAAPQIGYAVRIAVVDVSNHPRGKKSHGRLILINPKVVRRSEGSKVSREGCLSLPDLTANVRRPRKATIEYSGGSVAAESFEARCILHEIDHLDGILFLDRVASITDDVFRRQEYR